MALRIPRSLQRRGGRVLALTALFVALGCRSSSYIRPTAPLTRPWQLCRDPHPFEPCRRADDVEAWLHDPGLKILSVRNTHGGIQGAKVLTLVTSPSLGSAVFRAKWRAESTAAAFNDPRWELTAYWVQKFFLSPHEYVVPPAGGHCFALSDYRKVVDAKAKETFATVPCVFGILSYWLEDGRSLDAAHDQGLLADDNRAYDPELFRDHEAYRRSIADMNLLTYLIHHGDSHPKQFLVAGGFVNPRVYSVDNSISFGPFRNPTVVENWAKILVPALPESKIERLENVSQDQIEGLAAVEQFAVKNGQLASVKPTEPGQRRNLGIRWKGRELQIGLTETEIARFRKNLAKLLFRISQGNIQTF